MTADFGPGRQPSEPATGHAVLEALWHEHRRWVATVLLAHKPREAELEDLLQEVAMTLVSRVHELRDPGALRPWLRAVAVNVARMDARRVNVRRATLRPLGDEHHELADPAQDKQRRAAEASADARAALAAAQALPEELREPLLMRSVRGLSQKQIAAALGLPETTIETRLVRARRLLRERLAGSLPSAERSVRAAAGAQP
jgi:RNA polymerase sigma factor (sigma-70 family)